MIVQKQFDPRQFFPSDSLSPHSVEDFVFSVIQILREINLKNLEVVKL